MSIVKLGTCSGMLPIMEDKAWQPKEWKGMAH